MVYLFHALHTNRISRGPCCSVFSFLCNDLYFCRIILPWPWWHCLFLFNFILYLSSLLRIMFILCLPYSHWMIWSTIHTGHFWYNCCFRFYLTCIIFIVYLLLIVHEPKKISLQNKEKGLNSIYALSQSTIKFNGSI